MRLAARSDIPRTCNTPPTHPGFDDNQELPFLGFEYVCPTYVSFFVSVLFKTGSHALVPVSLIPVHHHVLATCLAIPGASSLSKRTQCVILVPAGTMTACTQRLKARSTTKNAIGYAAGVFGSVAVHAVLAFSLPLSIL